MSASFTDTENHGSDTAVTFTFHRQCLSINKRQWRNKKSLKQCVIYYQMIDPFLHWLLYSLCHEYFDIKSRATIYHISIRFVYTKGFLYKDRHQCQLCLDTGVHACPFEIETSLYHYCSGMVCAHCIPMSGADISVYISNGTKKIKISTLEPAAEIISVNTA